MVAALEAGIDDLLGPLRHAERLHRAGGEPASPPRSTWPAPIVRRAERLAVAEPTEGSFVVAYLNRLSDLLWAMARWQEGPEHVLSKGDPCSRP